MDRYSKVMMSESLAEYESEEEVDREEEEEEEEFEDEEGNDDSTNKEGLDGGAGDIESNAKGLNGDLSLQNLRYRHPYNLHQLARDGNAGELQTVLDSGYCLKERLNELDEKRCSPLHYAARYSHVATVHLLLEHGGEVDRRGAEKMTPLHYAARYGKATCSSPRSPLRESASDFPSSRDDDDDDSSLDFNIQVIKALLQSGADINAADAYRMTPLHHAAMRGNTTVVSYLAEQADYGVKLNAKDVQGSAPLHFAALNGFSDVVTTLLSHGAVPLVYCDQKQNPLHRAAQDGHIEAARTIFDTVGEDVADIMLREKDSKLCTPLFLAVEGGCIEVVELLLERGAADLINMPSKQGDYPLHGAARTSNIAIVEALINHGADVNQTNKLLQTPLFVAAMKGNLEIVEFFIEHGADVNIWDLQGYTAIMAATEEGHLDVVKTLKENGARIGVVDKDDKTVLHIAAEQPDSGILRELLDHEDGKKILEQKDQYDNTALHLAAKEGHTECISTLLDIGADIDNKNENEQTPFHLATVHGHLAAVNFILQKDRSSIYDRDEDDNTPLHLAAHHNQPAIMRVLLENGASVQDRNSLAWTPLDCAAAVGSLDCVKLLIDYDSPVDPLDRKQSTPLHLAAQFGHSQVVEFLLASRADITLTNVSGENALEVAIANNRKRVAETILESRVWKQALRTTSRMVDSRGVEIPNTPLRMLVRTFPDLVEQVLDQCITARRARERRGAKGGHLHKGGGGGGPGQKNSSSSSLTFDFEFLDDNFTLRPVVEELSGRLTHFQYCPVDDERNNLEWFDEPYNHNGVTRMRNNPLNIMIETKHKYLLKHPLCAALVRHKWKKFGRYVFYTQLILYILYLISISSYIMVTLKSVKSQTFPNSTTDAVETYYEDDKQLLKTHRTTSRVLVLIFTGIGVLFELLQLMRMNKRYFGVSNSVDWLVYVLSIVFVFNLDFSVDFAGCKGSKCWQWPVGSFLISLAWLNLLTYIRQLPFFGIYVLMFFEICKSVAKFSVVGFVFVMAFSMGFNILLINHVAFDTFGWSVMKTIVMATGEYEYEGIFVDDNHMLPFPSFTTFLFILFVFVVAIILMNLLVGLAVDDIKEVQEQAELQKVSSQVEHILQLERFLPAFLLKRLSSQKIVLITKKPSGWKVRDVISKQTIRETYQARIRDKEAQNETAVAELSGQVKELRRELSSIKELLGKLSPSD